MYVLTRHAASGQLGQGVDAAPGEDLFAVPVARRGRTFNRSRAALRAVATLGGGWALVARTLSVIPRPLSDAGYRVVARFRYAVFGRRASCRVPSAAERSRFLP